MNKESGIRNQGRHKTHNSLFIIHDSRKTAGFTLLEFIIYMALVTVIISAVSQLGFNIIVNKEKTETVEEISYNARFGMTKITDAVHRAELINTPLVGATSTTLSLKMASSSEDPTIFSISGGILQVQVGSNSPVDITSNEVTVSPLEFSNVSYPTASGTVRITATIESASSSQKIKSYNFSKTFYTTANIYK